MRIALLLAILTLAACGIDGPPTPPEGSVNVGGDARVGVVGGL